MSELEQEMDTPLPSFEELIRKKIKFRVGGVDFELDNSKMDFNEQTLLEYFHTEGMIYSYLGNMLNTLEKAFKLASNKYDSKYYSMFKYFKNEGASDKLAEASSKCDPEVETLKDKLVELEAGVNLLKMHLKAWDKNHENAQSAGHQIRKEMDIGARKSREDVMMDITKLEPR